MEPKTKIEQDALTEEQRNVTNFFDEVKKCKTLEELKNIVSSAIYYAQNKIDFAYLCLNFDDEVGYLGMKVEWSGNANYGENMIDCIGSADSVQEIKEHAELCRDYYFDCATIEEIDIEDLESCEKEVNENET